MASVAAPAGAAVDSTTAPPQADITPNKVPDAKEKRRRDVVQTTRWLMGKVSGLVVDVGGVQAVELETGAEVDSKPTPETEQLASDVLHQLFALYKNEDEEAIALVQKLEDNDAGKSLPKTDTQPLQELFAKYDSIAARPAPSPEDLLQKALDDLEVSQPAEPVTEEESKAMDALFRAMQLESQSTDDAKDDTAGGTADHKDAPSLEEKDLDKALEAKGLGNAAFVKKEFEDAIDHFTDALEYCPMDDKRHRAIFFCNRAACYVYMEAYDVAVEDCTCAIQLQEDYVKAYRRRADAYVKLDRLAEALEDLKKIISLDPADSQTRLRAMELEKEVKEQQKKQMEEMMGKLKDVGNSLLGKFGLSLDNFKAVQDPKTGGYSVSFSK